MSQSEYKIEQLEISIEEARKQVAFAQTIERLATNPDFKAVIMDDYFVEEASRLTLLLSDPTTIATPNRKELVMNAMIGIGVLKQHLNAKIQMGRQAEQQIIEMGETIDELRDEEAEGIE